LPWRSLGKSVHLNRPGKKHNSGLDLPPIAVTKVNKKRKNTIQLPGSDGPNRHIATQHMPNSIKNWQTG